MNPSIVIHQIENGYMVQEGAGPWSPMKTTYCKDYEQLFALIERIFEATKKKAPES